MTTAVAVDDDGGQSTQQQQQQQSLTTCCWKRWTIHLGQDLEEKKLEAGAESNNNNSDLPVKLRLVILRSQFRVSGTSWRYWQDTLDLVGQVSRLQHLTVTSFFTSSGKRTLHLSQLASLLSNATQLQELVLDQVGLYVEENKATSCFAQLQSVCNAHQQLQSVTVSRLFFPHILSREDEHTSSAATQTYTSELVTAFSSCPCLETLTLGAMAHASSGMRHSISEAALKHVLEHDRIRTLQLEHLNLLNHDETGLSCQESASRSLSALRFTNCTFPSRIQCLPGFLANSNLLSEVDLTSSYWPDGGVEGFCTALAENDSLQRITLCHARLGSSETAQHKNLLKIIKACAKHPALSTLDLRGLYDYHYDDDLSRPVELFHETLNAIIGLLKSNSVIQSVLVDEIDHPSVAPSMAALSFHMKLNASGNHSLLTSVSSSSSLSSSESVLMSELTEKAVFNRHELGYLFSVVRSNPLLRAD